MKTPRRWLLERLTHRRPILALLLGASDLHVASLRWQLPAESPLFASPGGEAIELRVDSVIAPYVLRHGNWQQPEVDFLARHAPVGASLLLDIGANVGLVARQLLHRLPDIRAAVCFEPHPLNHLLLTRNVEHLAQCHPVRAALGDRHAELTFYEDLDNAGNYSLHEDSMKGSRFLTSVVQCLEATEENIYSSIEPALQNLPVIYKSDTQGFDELIATTLPLTFWDKVKVGVMELSTSGNAFNTERLLRIVERFPIRRFGHATSHNLSAAEVLAFYSSGPGRQVDFYFGAGEWQGLAN
jgi:FkbM family methyltransferase